MMNHQIRGRVGKENTASHPYGKPKPKQTKTQVCHLLLYKLGSVYSLSIVIEIDAGLV
jgi:hypothetical protein